MEHFNNLTPGQAERLAILTEELGEAQQAIGKILRHGYFSTHPVGGENNREALERELGDVSYAITTLCATEDLREDVILEWTNIKSDNIKKYLHHNEN